VIVGPERTQHRCRFATFLGGGLEFLSRRDEVVRFNRHAASNHLGLMEKLVSMRHAGAVGRERNRLIGILIRLDQPARQYGAFGSGYSSFVSNAKRPALVLWHSADCPLGPTEARCGGDQRPIVNLQQQRPRSPKEDRRAWPH
jgi:hypothetical protein